MILAWLTACESGSTETGASATPEGPVLTETPPSAVLEGEPITFQVEARDDDGVGQVSVYHRRAGEGADWSLLPLDAGEAGAWSGTIEGDDVREPGVEYYFRATDRGEPEATSYLPAAAGSAPSSVAVSVDGAALPYTEDFEPEVEGQVLSSLGWANAGVEFRGYDWALTDADAHGGSYAAFHGRSSEEVDAIEDWLISPALDLSTASGAQVSWYEQSSAPTAGQHALWLSVGSRDPEDGEFVVVEADLADATGDAWGRSAVADLSAWAGNPVVYLAWVYTGVAADDWSIDDVSVGDLQADLSVALSVDPSPIHPGEAGTLTVTATNVIDAEATGVTVTVSFPDGGASVAGAGSLGTIAALGSASTAFDLEIDADLEDNRHLPVTVVLADGDGNTWSFDDDLLIGLASTASVSWVPDASGSLGLILGVGDPDAPTWAETVLAETVSETTTWAFDVTDQYELLPPAAGELRWYLRASSETGGTVVDFTLTSGGESWDVDARAVAAGEAVILYLPPPPVFAVNDLETTPEDLEPGTTGATLAFTIDNSGADTQGPVTATLTSDDADLTVIDGGPIDVSTDVFAGSSSVDLSGVFVIDVAAAHTDSTDLAATLTLDDGAESWAIDLDLPVPWPVMSITHVTIENAGDGILDPGEAADLTFEVTNIGDQGASGGVDGVLTAESTSTATVEVSSEAQSFGTLSVGSTKDADEFAVTVLAGADGDTVDLLLTLTDNDRSYEARTTLILGEPPWQALDSDADPAGDVVDDYEFDLRGGRYRVLDDVLQIQLDSEVPYDAATLFIEAWGSASGGDWTYYRLLLQSGVISLDGYDGDFVDLDDPSVTYVDDDTVQFDLAVESLGLGSSNISLGFAAGWCGEPDYYCDHYPDGWGYPYTGWDPTLFFDLSW
jgi:uncharacterized repeat protein (TIGR01451 family)